MYGVKNFSGLKVLLSYLFRKMYCAVAGKCSVQKEEALLIF
jgi:hypothetical protein